MGIQVEQVDFSAADYEVFTERLYAGLDQLRTLLACGALCEPTCSLGAEVELVLIDALGFPAPISRELLTGELTGNFQLEIDRFNLEYNLQPVPALGKPFSSLRLELEQALSAVERAAAPYAAHAEMIGILPTLTEGDLGSQAMTDLPRYHALSAALKRMRGGRFDIIIDGLDPLTTAADDVTLEGANTSFQVHVRTPADRFANIFNAMQLAAAPVLAVSTNSPLFAGHRLWEETRIALFKQSVDGRVHEPLQPRRPPRVAFGHGWVRHGAFELFAQAVSLYPVLIPAVDKRPPPMPGELPRMAELSLHAGTVWSWNRPVFDAQGSGHLRIEARCLPAGPTTLDMMASAAFFVGLAHGLAAEADVLVESMPFAYAAWNFYRAAQYGMDAEVVWPGRYRIQSLTARALAEKLLGTATRGLLELGVDAAEARGLLDVVAARIAHGMTGARWQRQQLAHLEASLPRTQALQRLVQRYGELSRSGEPVHTWKV